jgi:hypothetical protein
MRTTIVRNPARHRPPAGATRTVRSPGHAAIRHILTSPAIAPRTARYLAGDDVDWLGLVAEAETMSGGEALLVRIAYDLAEPESLVGVWEVARKLDSLNFNRVIEALRMSRGLDPGAGAEVVGDAA